MLSNIKPPAPPTNSDEMYIEYLYRYLSRTVSELNRVINNLDTSNITSLDVSALTGDIPAFIVANSEEPEADE